MSVKTRNSCPASPALSMPRSRDVFQDMEALTISRHDNPYLQVEINNFYDVSNNLIEINDLNSVILYLINIYI